MHVKDLASITGQIISMSIAVGNITRLLTRSCYATIEKRTSWNDTLHINTEVRSELEVWLGHIDSLNGIPMHPKSSAVGIVFSDASDHGFGGYTVKCGNNLVSGTWGPKVLGSSSTKREILAVKYVLLSLVDRLSGLTLKWFSDNQNVPRIIQCGSAKDYLQSEALSIFSIC